MRQTNSIFAPRNLLHRDITDKGSKNISRGGAEVARWAHNPKVIGSNPIPATMEPWHESAGVFHLMREMQACLQFRAGKEKDQASAASQGFCGYASPKTDQRSSSYPRNQEDPGKGITLFQAVCFVQGLSVFPDSPLFY
jgi:hypothetical protein